MKTDDLIRLERYAKFPGGNVCVSVEDLKQLLTERAALLAAATRVANGVVVFPSGTVGDRGLQGSDLKILCDTITLVGLP